MLPFLPFPFLYAEIHYRIIPKFFSRLFRKEPEIITDTVWRVDPDLNIPLLILIKDANLFSITLDRVIVIIKSPKSERNIIFDYNEKINNDLWWRIEFLHIEEHEKSQILEISTKIRYKNHKNKDLTCVNDNYNRNTPNFKVNVSADTLPGLNGWKQGDMHLHSFYTNDQIEFAAPIPVTAQMGRTLGLDFLGITDHAYDLDDSEDSYLVNDPKKPKWQRYLRDVEMNNQRKDNPLILPGFEVSVGNARGNSVHLQVFNSDELYEGSSDSGEKWLHSEPEWSLTGILNHLNEKSLACAAHIGEKPPLIHRLILGRGPYTENDLDNPDIGFFQLANGLSARGLNTAKKKWIQQLLHGRRVTPLAGSDSHGNFNLSRSIVLPHLAMDISRRQLLGEFRTAVWSKKDFNGYTDIIQSLRTGNVQITSGPLLSISEIENDTPIFGSTLPRKEKYLFRLSAKSSPEFGKITSLKVYYGDRKKGDNLSKEFVYESLTINDQINLTGMSDNTLYIRFEALTDKGFVTISSPVYLQ